MYGLTYNENVIRAYLRYVNAVLAGSLSRRTVQKVLQKIMRAGMKQPKTIAAWAMAKLSRDSIVLVCVQCKKAVVVCWTVNGI